jgi:hypothetical protein
MIETPTEQSPPLAPLQQHQQLQVDAFCANCGYNLHAQPVTRDPRLGIFICRCPECGQHHPAGVGVTAASVWASRLATALLVFWVLIVLNAFFWTAVALGALVITHIEVFTTTEMVAGDGREVEYIQITAATPTTGTQWVPVYKGTTQPAAEFHRVRTRNVQADGDQRMWRSRYFAFNVVMAAATALVAGVLLVVFLWHWPRRRYALVMLLPFLAGAGALALMWVFDWEDAYRRLHGWMISCAAAYALFEAVFLLIGIAIGRPVARGLLRSFIPPKARQHFAFLWRIDGKTPPAATVPA